MWGVKNTDGTFSWRLKLKPEASTREGLGVRSNQPRYALRFLVLLAILPVSLTRPLLVALTITLLPSLIPYFFIIPSAKLCYGKTTEEAFYQWADLAKLNREACSRGEITLEAFLDWLKLDM